MKNMNTNKYSSGGGGGHFTKIKGFTLIELLAVIIILGVLMIIAIPSVSSYITNARKNAYITTIKGYQSGISQKVNNLEYSFLDTDTTYYVHIDNIRLEKGGKSPFGEWLEAYVVVTYNGNGYDYYWTSVDESGYKVILKDIEDITIDDIINDSYKAISKRRTIENRDKIVIIDKNGNLIEETPSLELSPTEAENCYIYTKKEEGIAIYSYNNKCTKDVIIPSKIEGIDVIEIGEYTFENSKINSVKIANTIKIIGSAAFRNNNLKVLYIPESVTKIENEAFSTNYLTELPDVSNVTSMGTNVFANNQISEEDWFIYKKNNDGTYDYSTIVGYLGTDKDIIIPEEANGVKLTTIGASAFSGMNLTSVVIPDSVVTIGNAAFSGNKLTSVILPSNLKTIGGEAFYVNQLESLNIPNSVFAIGTIAFNNNQLNDEDAFIYKRTENGIDYSTIIGYGGKNRDNVIIPEEKNGVILKKIDNSSFYTNKIKKIVIPDTVTSIGRMAFNLNSLSDEDAYIYKRTEEGIDYSTIVSYGGNNKNIVIPKEVNGVELKEISDYAFYYAELSSVEIPDTVIKIGNNAFGDCYLTEVVIPASIEEIGSNAFYKIVTYTEYNMLTKIINKTGRSFDWKSITGSNYEANFVTGTIRHQYGNINVVDN